MHIQNPEAGTNVVSFPTADERKLSHLSPEERARAVQANKIFWHARHLHETITMKRDGYDQNAYIGGPILEITKTVCSQTMRAMAEEYRRLTEAAGK